MLTRLLEDYNSISKEIEVEEQAEMDRLLFSLFPSDTDLLEEMKDNKEAFKQHEKEMLSLLSLRIATNAGLIQNGYYKEKEQFENDIEKAIEMVESIECAWQISEAILRDTLEILVAVCPMYNREICSYFYRKYMVQIENDPVSQDLYFLFHTLASTYQQNGRKEFAASILKKLCQISRERNSLDAHQELVVSAMGKIGEDAPEEIVEIGKANEEYFRDSVNEYAGNFYWLYGSALEKLEKASQVMPIFEKCYEVRQKLYGEDNWYTAIAKREYFLLLYVSSQGKHGLEELCIFLNQIESGTYGNPDEEIFQIIEGKTLYIILMNWANMEFVTEYEFYLKRFEEICEKCDFIGEPIIKKRLAKNLWGGYYLKTGDYLLAERAFIEALETEMPDNLPEIVTEAQIKSNLLLIYYAQNDLEMAAPLLEELLDALELEEEQSGLNEKDEYRIYGILLNIKMQSEEEIEKEELDFWKEIADETCTDVQKSDYDLQLYGKELTLFLVAVSSFILQNQGATKEEMKIYLETLRKIEHESDGVLIDKELKIWAYHILGILAWNLNDAETENYLKKCIILSESRIVSLSTKVAVLQTCSSYFAKKGNYDTALQQMNRALDELTTIWQSYVKYLNDERLLQILVPTQRLFMACYAMLRSHEDTEILYERVLQFKSLASLAGKERNRIINSRGCDAGLLKKIRKIQDKIASIQMETMFRDISVEYDREMAELRKLETEFARRFPTDNIFMDISWEEVKKAIPDHSVVVEYAFCSLVYGELQFEENEIYTGLDIYIIRKENGECTLKRLTVPDGERILNQSDTFVRILQNESGGKVTSKQLYEKEDVRAELFRKLVKPIIPYIEGADTLYIAPEYDLMNLPFEILYDEEEEPLEDTIQVIKIECARDFLYQNMGQTASKGSMIIGNPQYELREREFDKDERTETEMHRAFRMNFDGIKQLPFAQVEAELIGKHCNSTYYTGFRASKNLLLMAKGYRNIHIATHGYFDLEDSRSSMYGSCLLFAGVKNWGKQGEISRAYGNGMVTADEVSRLDLRTVELAVLSSCYSGLNDSIINKGFYGMIGAMSAAGVKYVVSHLWEADDFATAVLMDAFYYQYVQMQKTPPEALRLAKKYLKRVTVGELKRCEWFKDIRKNNSDDKIRKLIGYYETADERIRPFKSEAYWSGFVCYQCR